MTLATTCSSSSMWIMPTCTGTQQVQAEPWLHLLERHILTLGSVARWNVNSDLANFFLSYKTCPNPSQLLMLPVLKLLLLLMLRSWYQCWCTSCPKLTLTVCQQQTSQLWRLDITPVKYTCNWYVMAPVKAALRVCCLMTADWSSRKNKSKQN